MFAIFNDLKTFNTWHENIKAKLKYPLIGVNAVTGEPDEENKTREYTRPITNINDPRIIAWVGDENEGLEVIEISDSQWNSWFSEINRIQ